MGYRTVMFDGYRDRDPQSESVSAPVEDDAPPRRTRSTLVPVTLGVLAIFVLGAALVWAALDAAA